MSYDPMRYVPRTGDAIMQGANQFAATIAALPQALRQDKEYQRAEAAYQSEVELINDAYEGTNRLFQSLGEQKVVRAPKPGESKEGYLQYIATELSSVVQGDNGEISPEKLQMVKERVGQIGLGDNQKLQTGFQRQDLLQQYGPMTAGQQQSNPMSQLDASQAPALMQDAQNRFGSNNTVMTELGEEIPDQMAMPNVPQGVESSAPTTFDPMAQLGGRRKTYYDMLKSGSIPNEKFLDVMSRLDEKEFDIQKAELDLEKARVLARKDKSAEDTLDRVGKGPVYEDGVEASTINPMDVRSNPDRYSFSPLNYAESTDGGSGGGSGGSGGSGSEKVSAKLRAESDRLVNDLKALSDMGEPLFGANDQYNRTLNEMKIISAAITLQEKKGGAALLSDDDAKKTARELTSAVNALSAVMKSNQIEADNGRGSTNQVDELERGPDGEFTNKGTLQLIRKNKGLFNQLPVGAYNKIIEAANEGYTLKEILDYITSEISN